MRKDVIWFEWYYMVSEKWEIKTKNYNKKWYEQVLKQRHHWRDKNYLVVTLRKPWLRKNALVHRIVAMAFIPNLQNKPQINHKDWNWFNNSISNLERCTNKENQKHAYDVLWRKWHKWLRYWNNKTARVVLQYNLEWKFLKEFDSITRAQCEFGVKKSNIWMVCNWYRNKALWYIWKYKNDFTILD